LKHCSIHILLYCKTRNLDTTTSGLAVAILDCPHPVWS
jgi:hypothetical protein